MTDDELILKLKELGFNPVQAPEHGNIMCGSSEHPFYILDPREEPDFDGTIDKDQIISGMWGGY